MLDSFNAYEDKIDRVIRRFRKIVPTLARIFLLGTFVDDSLRMITKYTEQKNFFVYVWKIGGVIASFFILINFLTQTIPVVMVLLRRRVHLACTVLLFNILYQHLLYRMRIFALFKTLSLCGVVLLLYAESFVERIHNVGGLPELQDNSSKAYLKLAGRMFVILILISLVDTNSLLSYGIIAPLCSVPALMVVIGYRSKLASTVLSVVLVINMLTAHPFWMPGIDANAAEYHSFEFFQSLSGLGGFLILVAHGPGGISLDEYKKVE